MDFREAVSVMDVLLESGDDREREAWRVLRKNLLAHNGWSLHHRRLDRVAWGDGNAEHDEPS